MAAPEVRRPREVGFARVRGETAGISWRIGWVAEADDVAAGCLFACREPDAPVRAGAGMPAMFVPLQELEKAACDTGYVCILSTAPAFRGRGIGSRLLEFAERYRGPAGMSLIVSDANAGARWRYGRHGYAEAGPAAHGQDRVAGRRARLAADDPVLSPGVGRRLNSAGAACISARPR